MEPYEIEMTDEAVDDLTELQSYVAGALQAPQTALSYIRAIRREIASLAVMPSRYRKIEEEPWHSRGLRKMIAKSFFVYYRIDESVRKVIIQNVIYARRDQLKALSEHESQ
jgi:toxin ParE1/3/4